MHHVKQGMERIIENIVEVKDQLGAEVDEMIQIISQHRRVFVLGAGRSGLAGKAFAMRLMHLGFSVNVIGETVTPAVESDDLVVAISGSGVTDFTVNSSKAAKEIGARIIAITSEPESALAEISDLVVPVKGWVGDREGTSYIGDQIKGKHASLTPLGTLFEDSCHVLLDGIIAELMQRTKTSEEELRESHANIE